MPIISHRLFPSSKLTLKATTPAFPTPALLKLLESEQERRLKVLGKKATQNSLAARNMVAISISSVRFIWHKLRPGTVLALSVYVLLSGS